jgi:hypothetical protein
VLHAEYGPMPYLLAAVVVILIGLVGVLALLSILMRI